MTEQTAKIEGYERIPLDRAHSFPVVEASGDAGYLAKGTPFTLKAEPGQEAAAQEKLVSTLSTMAPIPAMRGVANVFYQWGRDIDVDGSKRLADGEKMRGNHLALVLGETGAGKTKLAHVMADAMGAKLVDMPKSEGGKNADTLFVTTRPGGKTDLSKVDRLNVTLAQEPVNQDLVDQLLADGVPIEQKDGRYQLDASKMGDSWYQPQLTDQETDPNFEMKWQDDHFASSRDRRAAHTEYLDTVINDYSLNGITHDVVRENGPLLNALLELKAQYDTSGTTEPTVILLDEFNRFADPGGNLANLWEIMGRGRTEPIRIKDANNVSHTFTPDMFRNTLFYCTGNIPNGRNGAHPLPGYIKSRIGEENIFTIPNSELTKLDNQTRLEQLLLGAPVTLHTMAGNKGDENKWAGDNSKALWDLVEGHIITTKGVSSKTDLPQNQQDFLRNGPNVVKGIEKVAGFLHAASALIHPPTDPQLRQEITAMGDNKPHFDLGMYDSLMKNSNITPLMVLNAIDAETTELDGEQEVTAKTFGTALVGRLKSLVDNKFTENASPAARRAFYTLMYQYDIIDRDTLANVMGDDNEMPATKPQELVADLINSDPGKSYADFDDMTKIFKEVLAVRDAEADPTITQARYGEIREHVKEQDDALMEAKDDGDPIIGSHRYLPETFSEILVPNVRMVEDEAQGVKLALDLNAGAEIDAITREEQLSEYSGIFDTAKQLKDAPNSLASTQEIMLGLLLTDHTHEAISAMFTGGLSDAVETDIAQGKLAIDERVLEHNSDDEQKPRLQKAVEGAKNHFDSCVSWMLKTDPNPDQNELLKSTYGLAQNIHDSGLGTTTLHTVGFNAEKGAHFDDALTIVNVQPKGKGNVNVKPKGEGNKNPDQMLVVGTSPLSAEFVAKLQAKSITYVCTQQEGAKEAIITRLKSLHQIAKQQLQVKGGDSHPDLKEDQAFGLLLQLENAMNLRTSDAYDAEHVQPAEGEDWLAHRLSKLADHMLDERCRTGEKARLEHATRVTPVEHDGKVEELRLAV